MLAYNPQSFVSVTFSFTVCLDTHEIPCCLYSYFCLKCYYMCIYVCILPLKKTYIYICILYYIILYYIILHYIYKNWNLYILNRYNKLRKWAIPFHAIWGLCWYIFFLDVCVFTWPLAFFSEALPVLHQVEKAWKCGDIPCHHVVTV